MRQISGSNIKTTQAVGIDQKRIVLFVYSVSGFLAAFAGWIVRVPSREYDHIARICDLMGAEGIIDAQKQRFLSRI